MKTALITTTINVPTVLELYRQHGPDVAFFVAGDTKSPDEEIIQLQHMWPGENYYWRYRDQHHWKCSELIGPCSIQRRNIALLEAVKWGADIIVSIDDDNICLDDRYFDDFLSCFYQHDRGPRLLGRMLQPMENSRPFNGIKVSSPTGWFDVGQLLDPVAPHRGFPINVDGSKYEVGHVTGAKVGAAAGICLGDPDISAVTRIAARPVVHRVSELLNSGIVVDLSTKTVWNSQNTALIRELVPAWGMVPFIQRYDDILASLVCGRVMRERGLHVHFGRPYCWQSRNAHNLIKDLRGEIEGMDIIEQFAFVIDETKLQGKSVIGDCRTLWGAIDKAVLLPEKSIAAMLAYVDDCEAVL